MTSVVNKTRKSIRIPLPGGKSLFLGPGKTGQIADRAAEAPAVKKLIEAGEIEVQSEGSQAVSSTRGGTGKASSHGHAPKTMPRSSGDR